MRSRLLGLIALLSAASVLALGVPLAITTADSEQERVFGDRFSVTTRLASDAQRVLVEDRPALIVATLARYQQVYGLRITVLDPEWRVVATSPTPADTADPANRSSIVAALAGQSPQRGGLLAPWSAPFLTTAQPVLLDGQVRGVVVVVSPTERARLRVLRAWLYIAGGSVLLFGAGMALAVPLVRWFLRPVQRMDEATGEFTAAVLAGRELPHSGFESAPPELRRLAGSLFTMADRVSGALAAQRAFVADASHRLRNPLTALTLRLSNLREELPADTVEQADAASDEARRLAAIVDDLLRMARAEADTSSPQPVEVCAVVTARLAAWHSAAAAREVTLATPDPPPGEPVGRVLLPPGGLETVLDALLDNAVKFTAPGSTVEVAAGPDGERSVAVEIRDRGPGLRDTELVRATDRFWRSPRDQNTTGTGLGLAIVAAIVDRVAGSIVVRNRDGGGLVVRVSLPSAADGDRDQGAVAR